MKENVLWDTRDILEILPHRFPFLLVDKVLEFEPDKRVLAIKCVTANEPFFTGHFPGNPVMPGVLILEAMAQSSAIMALKSPNGMDPGKNIFIVGAKEVKFKKTVVPGDCLRIETEFIKKKGPLWICASTVTVDGALAASAVLSAMEVEG